MDLVGPLKESPEGYKYFLTLVDYFTKWIILKPLRTKQGHEVAQALLEVYSDWGVCDIHISDQGTEFCNELLDGRFCKKLSWKH
jgi:IS30 family transposase